MPTRASPWSTDRFAVFGINVCTCLHTARLRPKQQTRVVLSLYQHHVRDNYSTLTAFESTPGESPCLGNNSFAPTCELPPSNPPLQTSSCATPPTATPTPTRFVNPSSTSLKAKAACSILKLPLCKQADTAYDCPQIQHVDTSGIRAGVDVYFSIDSYRCFVAHINGLVHRTSYGRNERWLSYHEKVKEQEAEFFRVKTVRRLGVCAEKYGLDPVVQKSEILRTLLITCPEPREWGMSRLLEAGEKEVCDENTGLWVAQGVKDFLGALKNTPVHKKEGFVIHDPPGEFSKPVMLSYEPKKWPDADEELDAEMAGRRQGVPPELKDFRRIEPEGLEK